MVTMLRSFILLSLFEIYVKREALAFILSQKRTQETKNSQHVTSGMHENDTGVIFSEERIANKTGYQHTTQSTAKSFTAKDNYSFNAKDDYSFNVNDNYLFNAMDNYHNIDFVAHHRFREDAMADDLGDMVRMMTLDDQADNSTKEVWGQKGEHREKRAEDTPSVTNLAFNKTAWMSSNNVDENAKRATDGNTNTSNIETCAVTAAHDRSRYRWWRVDLESIFLIAFVNITNRGDCCGFALSNIEIRTSRHLLDRSIDKSTDDTVCGGFSGKVYLGDKVQITCDVLNFGRFLTVLVSSEEEYGQPGFCEVEVYGKAILAISAGEPCENLNDPLGRHVMCESGTVCLKKDSSSFCLITLGGKCDSHAQKDFCVHPTHCDSDRCYLISGCSCAGVLNDMCGPSSICDNDTCRIKSEFPCQDRTSICMTGYVCDYSQTCRKALGQHCLADQECLAGAECVELKCNCSQRAQISDNICVPNIGYPGGLCGPNGTCLEPNSECKEVTVKEGDESSTEMRCQCTTLLLKSIFACQGDIACINDGHCESGRVCDNPGKNTSKCAYDIFEFCYGNQSLCRKGSVCEKGLMCKMGLGGRCLNGTTEPYCIEGSICDSTLYCKLNVGSICDEIDDMCMYGTFCEARKCRLLVDQSCTKDEECIANAKCEGTCKPRPGKPTGTCNEVQCHEPNSRCSDDKGQTCVCIKGFTLQVDLTCRVPLHGDCTSQSCAVRTICDTNNTCKLAPGSKCTDPYDMDCGSDGFCDPENLVCMALIGGACLEGRTNSYCINETICNRYKCRIAVNNSCIDNVEHCIAGGYCLEETECVCNLNVSKPIGQTCSPLPGFVGGTCLADAEKPCHDLQSSCDRSISICACPPELAASSSQYHCEMIAAVAAIREAKNDSEQNQVQESSPIIPVLVAILLTAVIGSVVAAIIVKLNMDRNVPEKEEEVPPSAENSQIQPEEPIKSEGENEAKSEGSEEGEDEPIEQ